MATVTLVRVQREITDQERADVRKWNTALDAVRDYDRDARAQYAMDRRYARGDSGFAVDANIVGANIDILGAFLYARDPDLDMTLPPLVQMNDDDLRGVVRESVAHDPEFAGVVGQIAGAVAQGGGDAAGAIDTAHQIMVTQRAAALRKQMRESRRQLRAYCDTTEIVVRRMWDDGHLARRASRCVNSALTVGIGALKASWQERTAPSATTVQQRNDAVTRMQAIAAAMERATDAAGDALEQEMASIKRSVELLDATPEQVVERGYVIDALRPENILVPPGYALEDHLDAPWNGDDMILRADEAQAMFQVSDEDMKAATRYAPKPLEIGRRESPSMSHGSATDASSFNRGPGDFVRVTEIYVIAENAVLTMIDGIDHWVTAPRTPDRTRRFYPYFLFLVSPVDGQRHPQSLVARSARLVDSYNRIGSQEDEHRRRALPGVIVNGGMVSSAALAKVTRSVTGEYTRIKFNQPNTAPGQVFFNKPYAPVDPALYSRERIINEINRIWGVQEALAGAVQVSKTATEASIQEAGFTSRTQSRRDALERMLSDLAAYTAEVARIHVTAQDIDDIVGSTAFWPDYDPKEDLRRMMSVRVRAGSTGRPDAARDRNAWAAELPILQNVVSIVGQLRHSDPAEVAKAYVSLAEITVARAGDNIDVDALMPQAGAPTPAPGAVPPGVPPQGPPMQGPPAPLIPQAPIPIPASGQPL